MKGIFNKDGWYNILAGLGKKQDKTTHTRFAPGELIPDEELSNIWTFEGLGKKIISAPADDMTKNWISIEEDTDNKIQAKLDDLNAEQTINLAMKWTRLYRGCLVVIGADDGRKLEEPLNINNVKDIKWLKVYEAPYVRITTGDIEKDPKSKYFEEIPVYTVTKITGGDFKVHHSRCLVFKGEPIPKKQEALGFEYKYWGMSIMQSVFSRLKSYGSSEQSIDNLLLEVVIGKTKLSNLENMLSENNSDVLWQRMEIINACKSVINMVLLGENEEYTRDALNLTGLPEVIDRLMMNVSAVSEIPVTRLFGRSPAGQNATGESDLRTYYDMIMSKQKNILKDPVQYLVDIVAAALKFKGDATITFKSVWEPTQEELLNMKKTQAEIDQIYINTGVLSPIDVTDSRFKDGYSFETTVNNEPEPINGNEPVEEQEEE